MHYFSLDIGTTCCKYQVFDKGGSILASESREYPFYCENGHSYVNLPLIWETVQAMLRSAARRYALSSVCISTLGESFVLLDENDEILFYPMLYTDPRGTEEAEWLLSRFGEERLFFSTGALPQSMYSLSKLLWIKNHRPERFAKVKRVMLMGDYLGYLLTGERVIDYGLAARTGAFDVHKFRFDAELLEACGIPAEWFSRPMRAGSIVGPLRGALGALPGLRHCVLVLGSHDQICATLGAGVTSAGSAADGMGTVECITAVFDRPSTDLAMGRCGYPCVPFAEEGLYCTYILNYSCGSLIGWYKNALLHGYCKDKGSFFTYMEAEMKDTPSGILTLPYLGGAATPYQNAAARGAIVGLDLTVTDADLYRSLLEGCAMEMRLNAEAVLPFGISIDRAVATGGGSASTPWLQIKADIQNIPLTVLRSEQGGLCGCAMLQAVASGQCKNLFEAARVFVQYGKTFTPRAEAHQGYESQYQKYKKFYHAVKELM